MQGLTGYRLAPSWGVTVLVSAVVGIISYHIGVNRYGNIDNIIEGSRTAPSGARPECFLGAYPYVTGDEVQDQMRLLATQGDDPSLTIENILWPAKFRTALDKHECDKRNHRSYEHLYDKYVVGLGQHDVKLMEIGIGCVNEASYGNQTGVYTPGRSVKVWEDILPQGKLHFVEYDEKCAEAIREEIESNGHFLFVGNQENITDLLRIIDQVGEGSMEVIVDDGGHTFKQQLTSFAVLFPRLLRAGGVYVIEDLEGSIAEGTARPGSSSTLEWTQSVMSLLTAAGRAAQPILSPDGKAIEAEMTRLGVTRPLIEMIRSVECFEDACVFVKKSTA